MKKERDDIARRLSVARRKLGFVQGEFADRLGISKPTLVRYESGTGYPDARTLQILVTQFKVSINWLLTGDGELFVHDEILKRDKSEFGEFREDVADLLFHLREVPFSRYPIIKPFIIWKHDNRNKIADYLKTKRESNEQ